LYGLHAQDLYENLQYENFACVPELCIEKERLVLIQAGKFCERGFSQSKANSIDKHTTISC